MEFAFTPFEHMDEDFHAFVAHETDLSEIHGATSLPFLESRPVDSLLSFGSMFGFGNQPRRVEEEPSESDAPLFIKQETPQKRDSVLDDIASYLHPSSFGYSSSSATLADPKYVYCMLTLPSLTVDVGRHSTSIL